MRVQRPNYGSMDSTDYQEGDADHPKSEGLATTLPRNRSCPASPHGPTRESIVLALHATASKQHEVWAPIIVQLKDIHHIKNNMMRVPQKVPLHQQTADSQVPKSKSCNSKRPHEAPTTLNM